MPHPRRNNETYLIADMHKVVINAARTKWNLYSWSTDHSSHASEFCFVIRSLGCLIARTTTSGLQTRANKVNRCLIAPHKCMRGVLDSSPQRETENPFLSALSESTYLHLSVSAALRGPHHAASQWFIRSSFRSRVRHFEEEERPLSIFENLTQ